MYDAAGFVNAGHAIMNLSGMKPAGPAKARAAGVGRSGMKPAGPAKARAAGVGLSGMKPAGPVKARTAGVGRSGNKLACIQAACVILILFMVPLFAGCSAKETRQDIFAILEEERGSGKTDGEYDPVVINLVHSSPESSAVNRVANMFKTLVENRSKGEILVEIYPNDSLGYIYDYGSALGEGTVDAWIGSGASRLNTVVYWAPTLTDASLEDMQAFTASDAYLKKLGEECEESGYFPLGIFPAQYRMLTSNDAISSIDDFKTIKMRSYMERSLEKVYWNAMDVSVTSCDIHELYSALENGTVNAQSNTLPIIVSNRLYEQQAYSMELQHMIYYDGLYMGKRFYDGLDDSLKEAINQASEDIRIYARDMYQAEYSRCESILVKAGVKALEVEDGLRDQVKAMAAPGLEKALRDSAGDEDVDLVINELNEIKAARVQISETANEG